MNKEPRMREIKFRAWSGINKQMYPDGGGTFEINANGEIAHTDGIYAKDLILMQFTGLKDKNGVEIYEGDIMSPKEYLIGWGNQVVIWDNELPGFTTGKDLQFEECNEVIGNIYENPGLVRNEG